MKVLFSWFSKILIWLVMLEVIKFVNVKVKNNVKKMFKEKYENFNICVNECVKNVFCRENKILSWIFNKVKNKVSVLKIGYKIEENIYKNVLERRKVYEIKCRF